MHALDHIVPAEFVCRPDEGKGLRAPWWSKIAAKIVLGRILPSYRARSVLGIFRHGVLDREIGTHRQMLDDVLQEQDKVGTGKVSALLELGPGDSLGTALFAAARGIERVWLVDIGDFATRDMAVYHRIVRLIDAEAPGFAARVDLSSRERMLDSVGASYWTQGAASLAKVPDGAADAVFSTAVLEHIRRSEVSAMLAETFRILRPGGAAIHRVDLMDHLSGALNHLRFSEPTWEHPLMASSGFYTNRLPYADIVGAMRNAGFETAVTWIARWPQLPTPRKALAQPFRDLPEDELRIARFGVLLRKPCK